MSLARHEEIGRVGRVRRGCYENVREDAARVGLVEFGERHDTRTKANTIHHSRPPADHSSKRVAS